MRGARSSISKFASVVKSASTKVALLGAAMATAAVVGFALLVRQSFKVLDALGKTADKLGITTEALAGLHRAAKLSGNEIKTLEKGLQNMGRGIAEAADGTGEAKDALEFLNLEAKDLIKLSLDRQFFMIADAMENVTNATRKVSVAYDLFGGRGVGLINTLRGGSEALEENFRQLEKLGGAFSRIEVKQIERANDAIDDLRILISGRKGAGGVAVGLAPLVEGLANLWKDAGDDSVDMARVTVRAIGGIATAIDKVIGLFDTWLGLLDNARATMSLLLVGTSFFTGDTMGMRGAMAAADEFSRKAQRHFSATDRGDVAAWVREILSGIGGVSPRARRAVGGGGVTSLLGAGGTGGAGFGLQVGQLRQFVPGGGAARAVPITSPVLDLMAVDIAMIRRFLPIQVGFIP